MKVAYGAETAQYGPPDGYVVTVRGFDESRMIWQNTQMVSADAIEYAYSPWSMLAWMFERMSTSLRDKGVEPYDWDCGGYWHVAPHPEKPFGPFLDHTTDEHGDYLW